MVAAGSVGMSGATRKPIRTESGLVYPVSGGYGVTGTPNKVGTQAQVTPYGELPRDEPFAVKAISNLLDFLTRSNRRKPQRDTHDAGGAEWSMPTAGVDGAQNPASQPGTRYAMSHDQVETVRDLGAQRVAAWQDQAGERFDRMGNGGIDYGPAPWRAQRPWYSGVRATGGANSRGTTDTFFTRLRLRPMMLAANVAPGQATRRRSVAMQSPSTGAQARIPSVRVPVSSVAER